MEGLSKTPDEIKKGLEHCMSGRCDLLGTCPYEYECNHVDIHVLEREALAYIRQLEAGLAEWGGVCASPGGYEDLARENNELLKKIEQLETKCHQLERERNELVEIIKNEVHFNFVPLQCRCCKNFNGDFTKDTCRSCGTQASFGNFEWRGV